MYAMLCVLPKVHIWKPVAQNNSGERWSFFDGEHTNHSTCVEVKGQPQPSLPVFHLVLRWGLRLISTPHTRLSALQALKELSWLYLPSSHMSTKVTDVWALAPGFHICLGEPNLGLQACQVSTLPAASSSQARICSYEWIKIAAMFVKLSISSAHFDHLCPLFFSFLLSFLLFQCSVLMCNGLTH